MEIIEGIKKSTGMPDAIICRAMRIPESTLGRWRRRKKENHPFLNRPGPKKVKPFDPSALDAEKEELQRKVRDLEEKLDLAEKTIEVKDLLSAYEAFRGGGVKKNRGKKQKTGERRSVE